MNIAIYICLGIGLFFALAGVVGMLRMPDAYCRMQSSTNIATLGVLGVIAAAIIWSIGGIHDYQMTVKLAVLGLFYIITNPIAGHAVAKAAYWHGVKSVGKVDQLAEDLEEEDKEDA